MGTRQGFHSKDRKSSGKKIFQQTPLALIFFFFFFFLLLNKNIRSLQRSGIDHDRVFLCANTLYRHQSLIPFLHFSFSRGALPGLGLGLSGQDSGGQAIQGVQGEEDVRFALERARPVPQQLAALQVWRDVLHADGLKEVEVSLQVKARQYEVLAISKSWKVLTHLYKIVPFNEIVLLMIVLV